MSKQATVTARDLYLAVFDAAVSHQTLTVASLADKLGMDVPSALTTVRVLRDESLIELSEDSDTPSHERIVSCEDASRISRINAARKYSEVMQAWKDSQSQSDAPAAPVTPLGKLVPAAFDRTGPATRPMDDATATARRTIVLSERTIGTGKQASVVTFTSGKPAQWETEAILAHRNEHAHAVPCVVSGVGYAHTTTVPISSRSYNHMRVACQTVFHTVDSAVIRHLRSASLEQLEACVTLARESMAITVTVLSAKAAAKAIQTALAESE